MRENEIWLQWAVELQSLAQAGLTYSPNIYDLERFTRIRQIAAEMICHKTGLSPEKVNDLFCSETGYQTPKLDTRAAIFQDGKILLVLENDGLWSLPGGWVDVFTSVTESAIKEVKEEAGLDVTADLVIAIQDREKHNLPVSAQKICKVFFLCTPLGGSFCPNSETIDSGYFALDDLPRLCDSKNTREQIQMCFDAYHNRDHWKTLFD